MSFRAYATVVVVFVLVVVGGFAALQVADSGANSAARVADNVTNESVSQQVDIWQFAKKALEDETVGFNDSVTAYNASGALLERGVDYEWNASEGTIQYLNTANVSDGATGNLSYTYFRETQDVQALSAVIDPIVTFFANSGLLVGGFALVLALVAFGGIVARKFGDSPGGNR